MPFRHAHWAVLALLPIIVLAFWPGYFGDLRGAPFALHAHGIAATAWIVLVAWQSWTIHARRPAAHRAAGVAVFGLVPLFVGASLLTIRRGVALAVAQADPFHGTYGLRLAFDDTLSLAAFLALVCTAIAQRRRIAVHAGAMMATVWLVLPPILGRLVPIVPGFPRGAGGFALAFEIAQAAVVVGALVMARRHPHGAAPFRAVAAVLVVESLMFEAIARHPGWGAGATVTLAVPPAALAAIGVIVAAVALRLAWRRPRALNSAAASATARA